MSEKKTKTMPVNWDNPNHLQQIAAEECGRLEEGRKLLAEKANPSEALSAVMHSQVIILNILSSIIRNSSQKEHPSVVGVSAYDASRANRLRI